MKDGERDILNDELALYREGNELQICNIYNESWDTIESKEINDNLESVKDYLINFGFDYMRDYLLDEIDYSYSRNWKNVDELEKEYEEK